MSSKLQKWGNSIGVRIPKSVIEKSKLELNSEVEIEHKDGKIIIFPKQKTIDLKTLLAKITKDNLHSEDDFLTEGNEVW